MVTKNPSVGRVLFTLLTKKQYHTHFVYLFMAQLLIHGAVANPSV